MQPTHVDISVKLISAVETDESCFVNRQHSLSSTPQENARSIRWKRDDTSILSTLFALMRSGIVFCLREY